jgi:hypothetical protein
MLILLEPVSDMRELLETDTDWLKILEYVCCKEAELIEDLVYTVDLVIV